MFFSPGANVEHEDTDGMTALTWASMRGRMQAAQCLLDHGALINCADKTGRSPLDLAAAQGNPNLVQVCFLGPLNLFITVLWTKKL